MHVGQQDGDNQQGRVKGGGVPGYGWGGRVAVGSISHLLPNCRDKTSSDFQLPLKSRSQKVNFLSEGWVAKSVARQLATAALWVQIQTSLKNHKWAT